MRIQTIMRVVGQVLFVLAAFILIPFFFGLLDERVPYYSFPVTSLMTGVLGLLLYRFGTKSNTYSLRDGFLVVSSTWMLASIFAALPYYLSGIFDS